MFPVQLVSTPCPPSLPPVKRLQLWALRTERAFQGQEVGVRSLQLPDGARGQLQLTPSAGPPRANENGWWKRGGFFCPGVS